MKIVCPTCHTVLADVPEDYAPRPFCSVRCKLADLHNWFSETYRVSEPISQETEDEQRKLN